MGWNTGPRRAFDTEYDTVIVKQNGDGEWVVCKANHHVIQNFGPGEVGYDHATGHAYGIADFVEVREDDR